MGLWVHVSDTREHRLYEREASRAPSRELKRVSECGCTGEVHSNLFVALRRELGHYGSGNLRAGG